MDEKALKEAGKELLRVVLIAVVPVLIDSLTKGSVDYRVILTVAGVAVLRSIERYLHKAEVDNPVTNFLKFE